MTQLMRTIATSINALAGTHFCAPRRRVKLPLRLVLLDRKTQVPVSRATFEGYTSDISATGLAILLPVASFREQLLNQSHSTLRVVMELTTGAVEAEAAVVRYELVQINDGVAGLGCLLGAQILNMQDCDRERFIEHLRSIN